VDFLDRCRGSAPSSRERDLLADACAAAVDPDAEPRDRGARITAASGPATLGSAQLALVG